MPPDEIWSFAWTVTFGAYVGHVQLWTAIEQAITEREKIKLWMQIDTQDVFGFTYPTVAAGYDYSDAGYIAGLQQRIEDILDFDVEAQVNYWVEDGTSISGEPFDIDIDRLTFAIALPSGWTRKRPYYLRDESDPDYGDWTEDHDPPTDKIVRRVADGMACEYVGSEWIPTATPFHSVVDRRDLEGQCRPGDYLSGHLIQEMIDVLNQITTVYCVAAFVDQSDGNSWTSSSEASADDAWSELAETSASGEVGKAASITRTYLDEDTEEFAAVAGAGSWKAIGLADGESEPLAVMPLNSSVEWGAAADPEQYESEPSTADMTTGDIREVFQFDNHGDPIGLDSFSIWTESIDGDDEMLSAAKSDDDLPSRPADPSEPHPIDNGYNVSTSIRGYFIASSITRAVVDFTTGLMWKSGST